MTDDQIHDALDDLIGRWHGGGGRGASLHEWLGMTWEEYGPFAARAILPAGYSPPARPLPEPAMTDDFDADELLMAIDQFEGNGMTPRLVERLRDLVREKRAGLADDAYVRELAKIAEREMWAGIFGSWPANPYPDDDTFPYRGPTRKGL